jgi:hypothetical protein
MSEEEREKAFLGRAKALLDESEEDLDANILSRLRQARTRALRGEKRREPRSWFWFSFPSVAGMATALVAILVAVFYITRAPVQAPDKSIGDLEILTSNDQLELYENLDFYAWLAKEKENEG